MQRPTVSPGIAVRARQRHCDGQLACLEATEHTLGVEVLETDQAGDGKRHTRLGGSGSPFGPRFGLEGQNVVRVGAGKRDRV